jgi:hypothetical protein
VEKVEIRAAVILVASITLGVVPPTMATLINGTCDQGTAEVAATTSNVSTALTGWTYSFSSTPIGNYYIGTNIRNWNQRPGYTVPGVGMVQHNNPSGKWANVQQRVTDLQPGGTYDISAWLLPVLVLNQASGGTLTLGVQNPDSPGWIWGPTYGDDAGEKGVWANSVLTTTASAAGTIDIRIYTTLGLGGWTTKSTPNVAFDDITVTLVPEPAGMIVVLAGIAAMASLLRRRR